ncbi:MAG TPA: hypothetical protein VKI44_34015 [Acetobacteraceae bacterium]|nr:hypothetical protein [Acetobacteraceae bacterium]
MGLDYPRAKPLRGTQQTRCHPSSIDAGTIGDMQPGEIGVKRREQRPGLAR